MYNYSACLSFLVMSCHAIQLKIFSQRLLSFNSECGQIFLLKYQTNVDEWRDGSRMYIEKQFNGSIFGTNVQNSFVKYGIQLHSLYSWLLIYIHVNRCDLNFNSYLLLKIINMCKTAWQWLYFIGSHIS